MNEHASEHGQGRRWIVPGLLAAVLILHVCLSLTGITWGLPTRAIDKYLFGNDEPWPGEKIYRLAGAGEKFSPTRGADVDVDPLKRPDDEPILLTGTEEDVARIYLRYRLYTYQPDEMITMMALAGMRPAELNFDPRLYQYGGLFIYPVGALIRLCGAVGLIDVRSDVVYYLDHPDEFGKFYIVSRAYAALWGLMGVIVVFAIARRLAGPRAAVLAALLFALMPVVVCMSHEGKPHLPGAVLMLLAVYFGMRCVAPLFGVRCAAPLLDKKGAGEVNGGESNPPQSPLGKGGGMHVRAGRSFWLMCACCGAALGMVINTWPIFVLIPLVAWLCSTRAAGFSLRDGPDGEGHSRPDETARSRGLKPAAQASIAGVALGFAVYLLTNPYLVINLFVNREVLRSNFGNSLAMYEISRVFEGFVRVLELTVEGATLPILVLGVVALVIALAHKAVRSADKLGLLAVLAVPAAVFFLQFCLIGAGKPAEYGRFGIFPNTALAIGAACLLSRRWTTKLRDIVNWLPAGVVVIWVAVLGAGYLRNFVEDALLSGTRLTLADSLADWHGSREFAIALDAVPAPYNCPPLDFRATRVYLAAGSSTDRISGSYLRLVPVDVPNRAAMRPQAGGRPRHSLWSHRGRLFAPIGWANKPFRMEPSGRIFRVNPSKRHHGSFRP